MGYMPPVAKLKSVFLQHPVYICYGQLTQPTVIVSLSNIKRLIFLKKTECVYYEVRILKLFTSL